MPSALALDRGAPRSAVLAMAEVAGRSLCDELFGVGDCASEDTQSALVGMMYAPGQMARQWAGSTAVMAVDLAAWRGAGGSKAVRQALDALPAGAASPHAATALAFIDRRVRLPSAWSVSATATQSAWQSAAPGLVQLDAAPGEPMPWGAERGAEILQESAGHCRGGDESAPIARMHRVRTLAVAAPLLGGDIPAFFLSVRSLRAHWHDHHPWSDLQVWAFGSEPVLAEVASMCHSFLQARLCASLQLRPLEWLTLPIGLPDQRMRLVVEEHAAGDAAIQAAAQAVLERLPDDLGSVVLLPSPHSLFWNGLVEVEMRLDHPTRPPTAIVTPAAHGAPQPFDLRGPILLDMHRWTARGKPSLAELLDPAAGDPDEVQLLKADHWTGDAGAAGMAQCRRSSAATVRLPGGIKAWEVQPATAAPGELLWAEPAPDSDSTSSEAGDSSDPCRELLDTAMASLLLPRPDDQVSPLALQLAAADVSTVGSSTPAQRLLDANRFASFYRSRRFWWGSTRVQVTLNLMRAQLGGDRIPMSDVLKLWGSPSTAAPALGPLEDSAAFKHLVRLVAGDKYVRPTLAVLTEDNVFSFDADQLVDGKFDLVSRTVGGGVLAVSLAEGGIASSTPAHLQPRTSTASTASRIRMLLDRMWEAAGSAPVAEAGQGVPVLPVPGPSIVIQPALSTREKRDLRRFQFWCAHGNVLVVRDLAPTEATWYSAEWRWLSGVTDAPSGHASAAAPRPSQLEEMVSVAKNVSLGFPFLLVDMATLGSGAVEVERARMLPATLAEQLQFPAAMALELGHFTLAEPQPKQALIDRILSGYAMAG